MDRVPRRASLRAREAGGVAELRGVDDPKEWVGTEVRFDIARVGDATELRFTHVGLVSTLECFEGCSRGWRFYAGESLRKLIMTGKGKPDPKTKARVAA